MSVTKKLFDESEAPVFLSDPLRFVPCGSHPRSGKAKMTGLERFLALFTQQVQHTGDTVAHIDHPVWTTVPVDSDANYLGLRVNRITIAALLRHLCLTETLWFNTLPLLDQIGRAHV